MKLISRLKQLDIILVIVLIAGISAVVSLYIGAQNTSYSSMSITSGWQYSWTANLEGGVYSFRTDSAAADWQDIALPGEPLKPKGLNSIWYRVKLPESEWPEASLFFRSTQQTVKVYLEGDIIYNYGTVTSADKKTAPGSIWNTVKLPPNYQGKTVYIELFSPFPQYAGYLGEVKIGSKSSLIIEVINRNMISLGIGSFFLFIGLACLVVYYFGKRFDDALQGLGFSTFFVGIWTIAESKIVQFFLYAPLGWMYTAYIAIYLAPVGYCIFYERFFKDRNNAIYQKLKLIFLIFALCSLALEFTHLVSIFTTVKIFHILLIFSMVLSAIFSIQSALRGDKEALIFTVGFIILSLAGVYDILSIFYPKILFVEQRMTQWGMLIFVLISASLVGVRLKNLYAAMAVNSRKNQMNYRGLFTNMIDACLYCKVIVDDYDHPRDFLVLETNKAFQNLWGGHVNIQGKRIGETIPPSHQKEFKKILGSLTKYEADLEMESPIHINNRWFKVSAFSPIPGFLCLIFKDITTNKEAEDLIKYQAFHDSITGLYNRMFFEQLIQRLEKEGPKLTSIISVDLDGLKIVNDTFGHITGDLLLKDAAQILQSVVIEDEYVTRIGGDEFALVLPKVDSKTALTMVEQIIEAVEQYNNNKPLIPLSMSLGVATFNTKSDKNLYDVYRRADDNMYQYKLGQANSVKSGVIEMLLASLAKKDYALEGHVERLASMAAEMAERLNLAAAETRRLVLLAKMHDLGKIGIPDDILFKPGKLTATEFNKIKEHSKIGYSIANRINELSQIASLILHHHEHWDGNGYPDGLKGKEIPVECRILSIIDAYDAMICTRPYSDGLKKEEAVQELERCAGTQFDPAYVQVFIEILNDMEMRRLRN